MLPMFAQVVFSTWQAVFLIILCFGSLAASLYCIFFMVPLRSFMKHVNSLGGGMEGIRSHVEGVREKIETRLDKLEEELQETLDTHKKEVANKTTRMEETANVNKQRIDDVDEAIETLKDSVGASQEQFDDLNERLQTLRTRQASLNSDVQALEGEIEGAVQKSVRDAYNSLEGSILGALEALQDEMLRPAGSREEDTRGRGGSGSPGSYLSGDKNATESYADKIISAEPLFAEVEDNEEATESDQKDDTSETTDPDD